MSKAQAKSQASENLITESAAQEQVQQLLAAVSDAMTDRMVERGAIMAGNALEVVDRLNDPDTRDAVHALLDGLTELHRTGGLVTLFEAVHFLNAMRDAATDNIIERAAIFIEQMVNNLAIEEVAALAGVAQDALHEAVVESAAATHKGGLFATVGMLSKPETQASLDFLLTFAKKLRERA
ncbi:MAG: hypothetical protein ACE5H7_08340 [Acidiferrobacterales bacterium]